MSTALPALVAATAMLLTACGAIEDTYGSYPEAGANLDSGGLDSPALDSGARGYGQTPCGQCALTACTTATCAADRSGCQAYVTCLAACPVSASGQADAVCAGRCENASNTTATSTAIRCIAAGGGGTCLACGADGGAWDGSVLGQHCPQQTDTTPCYTCEDNFCCDTYAACHEDPDCVAYLDCLLNCDKGIPDDGGVHDSGLPDASGDCDFYCFAAHPEGLTHFA